MSVLVRGAYFGGVRHERVDCVTVDIITKKKNDKRDMKAEL